MSKNDKTRNLTGGVGFSSLLTLVFITLKLCKVIDWSWWWVLSPMWISAAILLLVVLFLLLVFLVFGK